MNPSYKTVLHFALRDLEFVLKLRNRVLFAYFLFQKCVSLCFQVPFKYLSSWAPFIDHFQSVNKNISAAKGILLKKRKVLVSQENEKFSIYISKHIKRQCNLALSADHNKTLWSLVWTENPCSKMQTGNIRQEPPRVTFSSKHMVKPK